MPIEDSLDIPDEILEQIELEEETGEIRIVYYLLGTRPVKVTYIDDFPEFVQTPDFEKKEFVFDRETLHRIHDSMDAQKVDELTFRNACLAQGVKPV
ncbi:MAG: hypothetical protein ACRBDL_00530 [Alphaproteobacteria bacterium]